MALSPMIQGAGRRHVIPLSVLVATFLLTTTLYNLVVPLWEAPDEPEHFQYVVYLEQRHSLPTQLPTIQTDGNNEGKQPPLYYLLALPFAAGVDLSDAVRIRINPHAGWAGMRDGTAAAMHGLDEGWPFHGSFLAAHRIRLLSALLGALTLTLTYGIALTCTGNRRTALLAAALMAFLPGFLFTSSTIDNDALADTFSAALILVAMRTRAATARRQAMLFGTLTGLVLLTKLTALPAVAVGGGALLLLAGKGERRYIPLLVALPTVLPACYWLWRIANGERRLIGRPFAWPPSLPGMTAPLNWSAPITFVRHFVTSFFGVFSWGSILMPFPVYALYTLGFGTGIIFAARALRQRGTERPTLHFSMALIGLPLAQFASMVAANLLVSQTRVGMDHSRLFYPALPAVVTVVAYGWSNAPLPSRARSAIAAIAVSAMALLAAAVPLFVIRPVYAPPWLVSNQPPGVATRVANGQFRNSVSLVGVRFPQGPIGAGQGFYAWFYWRVQRPLPAGEWLFVHVVNVRGDKAAAFDGTPSSGTLPLIYWRPGDVVYEREVLTIHPNAASGQYAVHVGWYNPKSGVRVAGPDGATEVSAGVLQIEASPAAGMSR